MAGVVQFDAGLGGGGSPRKRVVSKRIKGPFPTKVIPEESTLQRVPGKARGVKAIAPSVKPAVNIPDVLNERGVIGRNVALNAPSAELETAPSFLERLKGMSPEATEDFSRALLTAGTSILEAGAAGTPLAQVSRGVLEGTKALDVSKGERAKKAAAGLKGVREAEKITRGIAETKRKAGLETERIGLEARRVAVLEKGKPVSDELENRALKAEASIYASTLRETDDRAEAERAAQEAGDFIRVRGKGGVIEPEIPAEEPGFFGKLFGEKGIPGTPRKVTFPRASENVKRVRERVGGVRPVTERKPLSAFGG